MRSRKIIIGGKFLLTDKVFYRERRRGAMWRGRDFYGGGWCKCPLSLILKLDRVEFGMSIYIDYSFHGENGKFGEGCFTYTTN